MATSYTSTLLELVQAASEFASTDDEIVAAVTHLINSGNVLLGGTFAGARIDLSPRVVGICSSVLSARACHDCNAARVRLVSLRF